jgi:hypothetical protein
MSHLVLMLLGVVCLVWAVIAMLFGYQDSATLAIVGVGFAVLGLSR